MQNWEPESLASVTSRFDGEFAALSPFHRALLRPLLIRPRQVPVADGTGDSVWAVAQRGDYVLYREDVEEGWEWQQLDDQGCIPQRQCNQWELINVALELFGLAPSDHPADV